MSESDPPQSTDNPIAFVVAAAGHTHGIDCMSYEVVAQNHSQITPSFIADEVNRQHVANCGCPWHGSRNLIYAFPVDVNNLFVSDSLKDMSFSNPPNPHALIPSLKDWALAPGFTASLPANQAHFIICREPNDALKRKASSSNETPSPPPKQPKLTTDIPPVVKKFGRHVIVQIGDDSSREHDFVPEDLHEAFVPTKGRRVVIVDPTRIIEQAFTIAGDAIGWGFYASRESLEDLHFLQLVLMAFLDIHPQYASAFIRTFENFTVTAWMKNTLNSRLHSRSFVLYFTFGEITPLDTSTDDFTDVVEQAVFDGVEAAVNKYEDFPGMESLSELIEGCTGSQALKLVLRHIAKKRSSGVFDAEIAIIVDEYDYTASLAHSADITGSPETRVPLGVVTRIFKACFYTILSTTLSPIDNKPVIQRLVLHGSSPAFTENLCLSLPTKDLSSIPGVPGLTIGQIQAQLAFMLGVNSPDDPHVRQAISALAQYCPVYSYTDITTAEFTYHIPRKFLTPCFSAIARKPTATADDVKKAIGSHKVKAFPIPDSISKAICKLYGRGIQFWDNSTASDLLSEKLEVRVAGGCRLRLSYSNIPKDIVTADSGIEITEITPLHVAQFLFEEGVLTWRRGSDQRYYYKFPSTVTKNQFIRDVVERSLLKTHKVPARYKEPAELWLKEVLSNHFKHRPFASVVHIVENVLQTALDIIAEIALPTSGELYGYCFMELKTQLGKRIDNALFIYKSPSRRPRASLWELKSIPIGDILEATLCCTLPRESDKSIAYSAFGRMEDFIKCLASFPASEWEAKDYSPNFKHWPKVPTSRPNGWMPTKLKDLFYWGYDNSDPNNKGVRVRYSIFNVIFQSDQQVWGYGTEVAGDGPPGRKKSSTELGGLRDERVQALRPSDAIKDEIDLGIVILLAGRFIITRNVGSVETKREFRVVARR